MDKTYTLVTQLVKSVNKAVYHKALSTAYEICVKVYPTVTFCFLLMAFTYSNSSSVTDCLTQWRNGWMGE